MRALRLGGGLLLGLWMVSCRPAAERVVVYASQDQVYAEPILARFQAETGIPIDALYDSEAVKTVGLFKRLLSEKQRPRCDLFWNNEELRTRQLGAQGVFRSSNSWASFGYRSRRLVVNTNQLSLSQGPRSLIELTNVVWRKKVALAYPLFGSTATHFLALRQHWGQERWLTWCRALQANEPLMVDGNSVVVQMVGRGEAVVGMTDSDDIVAGQRNGLPVAAMPLNPEMLLIGNTVGLVRDGPNPAAAEILFRFLQRPDVVEELVTRGALEGVNRPTEATLPVNWETLLVGIDAATEELRQIFLR